MDFVVKLQKKKEKKGTIKLKINFTFFAFKILCRVIKARIKGKKYVNLGSDQFSHLQMKRGNAKFRY